jgi:hypothetical protein
MSLISGWNLDESVPYDFHIMIRLLRLLMDGLGKTNGHRRQLDNGCIQTSLPPGNRLGLWSLCPTISINPARHATPTTPTVTDPGDKGPNFPNPSWPCTKVASVATAIALGTALIIMCVMGHCWVGLSSNIADAIVWAAGGQIHTLLSLAGKSPFPSYLQSAVNQVHSPALCATVIAAGGIIAQNARFCFPESCQGVTAVGASTCKGTRPPPHLGVGLAFSERGGDADNAISVLALLGVANWQLTQTLSMGTSFAAPHAAGVCALLKTR